MSRQNLEHIARHGVDPDEAEAVLDGNPLVLRTADGKYLAYGQSDEGRHLLVVFVRQGRSLVRAVTAGDLTESERKRYRRRHS